MFPDLLAYFNTVETLHPSEKVIFTLSAPIRTPLNTYF
jgi:hypothetical protein